jgi:hypothetical protein
MKGLYGIFVLIMAIGALCGLSMLLHAIETGTAWPSMQHSAAIPSSHTGALSTVPPSQPPPTVIAPTGPEAVVYDVFRQMGEGKVDTSKVVFTKDGSPFSGVGFTITPSGNKRQFHGIVKFPLKETNISAYDPRTESVRYSVRVPHPCVMFWQWDAVYPEALTRVPRGLLMEGTYKLTRSSSGAWQVKVDTDTNPIALYNKVYGSVNQIWFTGISSGELRGERLRFVMLMLFAAYTVALDIPDGQEQEFARRTMDECSSILPKENVKNPSQYL